MSTVEEHEPACQVGPSLLAADPLALATEMASVESADFLHVDIFDDGFVQGATWGEHTLLAIADRSAIPVEVHLMVSDPLRWGTVAASAKCERVIVHVEAAENAQNLIDIIERISELGISVGVAISPQTDPAVLGVIGPLVEQVLVMTVEPGDGGKPMLNSAPDRVKATRQILDSAHADAWIGVDGGVNLQTIPMLSRAGARRFVVGSGLFHAKDRSERILQLRRATEV